MTGFARFKSFVPGIVLLAIFAAVLFAVPTQDRFFTHMMQWTFGVAALLLLIAGLYAAAKPSVADQEMIREERAIEAQRQRLALESSQRRTHKGSRLKRALKR